MVCPTCSSANTKGLPQKTSLGYLRFGAFLSAGLFCRAHDELRNFYRPATTRNETITLSDRRRIHIERTVELMQELMAA